MLAYILSIAPANRMKSALTPVPEDPFDLHEPPFFLHSTSAPLRLAGMENGPQFMSPALSTFLHFPAFAPEVIVSEHFGCRVNLDFLGFTRNALEKKFAAFRNDPVGLMKNDLSAVLE